MKYPILPAERQWLRQCARERCSQKNLKLSYSGEVYPISDALAFRDFVEQFLKSRGIVLSEAIQHCGLWAFGHVNMHIDNITPKDHHILMIPVKGTGELAYMEPSDFYKRDIIASESFITSPIRGANALVFDDHKPHAFIARSKLCYAILAPVPHSVFTK